MKGILSTITLISFAGIAVFGLWGMAGNTGHHMHINSFSSCLGSLSQGTSCPINPVESVSFHLNSFKSFSNSPVPQSTENIVIISLFLILISVFILNSEKLQFKTVGIFEDRKKILKIFKDSFYPFKKERIYWNTLHENSPNFL